MHPEAAKVYKTNMPETLVLSDVRSNERFIRCIRTGPAILNASWPCQPWSALGDQRGIEDDRAGDSIEVWVRLFALIPWLSAAVECTPMRGNEGHLASIESVLSFLGMQWTHRPVGLRMLTPMKRYRWLAMITPTEWPSEEIEVPDGPWSRSAAPAFGSNASTRSTTPSGSRRTRGQRMETLNTWKRDMSGAYPEEVSCRLYCTVGGMPLNCAVAVADCGPFTRHGSQ